MCCITSCRDRWRHTIFPPFMFINVIQTSSLSGMICLGAYCLWGWLPCGGGIHTPDIATLTAPWESWYFYQSEITNIFFCTIKVVTLCRMTCNFTLISLLLHALSSMHLKWIFLAMASYSFWKSLTCCLSLSCLHVKCVDVYIFRCMYDAVCDFLSVG